MADMIMTEDDESTNVGLGCALDKFVDRDEVVALFTEIPQIYQDDDVFEQRHQRLVKLLDCYLEQPHLLDSSCEQLLALLLGHIDNFQAPAPLIHTTFKYMSQLTKVRGPRTLVRRFPHEVDDLLRVLDYLEVLNSQKTCDHRETRYMLLLWLSILVITPFSMTTFDDGSSTPITDRIFLLAESYLNSADKSRDAAALVASKFVTRPDIAAKHLVPFIDKMFQIVETDAQKLHWSMGALACLACVFKHGRRSDLQLVAAAAQRQLVDSRCLLAHNTHIRKLALKLLHRIGLSFLPVRVARWRYQRGQRSLAANLQRAASNSGSSAGPQSDPSPPVPPATTAASTQQAMDTSEDQDEGYDVPELLEELLEHVLFSLRDPVTVCRWSAAKGVGRIAGRLPAALADDVVDSLLDIFTVRDLAAAWHGGCLAMAELGRRGLLSVARLREAVPLLLRALVYDELQGNYAVGASVRDAACYLCWSLARAYQPEDFRQHALQVAPALLCVALFDREIGCRRAASAAFQENVGRQGTFPHGIEILTTVDYYAVGNRASAYTKLSVFVGGFPEYTKALMSHLLEKKVGHWDIAIRDITSKALHCLTPCDPVYAGSYLLAMLRPRCLHLDTNLRHGAILALAEVVHSLSETPHLAQRLDMENVAFISTLLEEMQKKLMFRGVGSDLMRKAVCHLIRRCSEARLPLPQQPTIDGWQLLLDECLTHAEDSVREQAVAAVPAFTETYVASTSSSAPIPAAVSPAAPTPDDVMDSSGCSGDVTSRACVLLDRYLSGVDSDNQVERRGFALALGALPVVMLRGQLARVVRHLISCCTWTEATRLWAECRRDGVQALTSVCATVGVDATDTGYNGVCGTNIGEIYECLLCCLDDYTFDQRGDIGAWVREAAMTGLQRLTVLVSSVCPALLTESTVRRLMVALSQLSVEKIDRTRGVAGAALSGLLSAQPPVPHVPDRTALETALSADGVNWCSERDALPRLGKLLHLDTYRNAVMLGLLLSAGGITERLVETAGGVLRDHLCQLDSTARSRFMDCYLNLMEQYSRQGRVSVPLLRALPPLLTSGVLDVLFDDSVLGDRLLVRCRRELARCADVQKLMVGVDVLCSLLEFPADVRRGCLAQLCVLLCHRYPRVRRATAQGLYESLLTLECDDDEEEENPPGGPREDRGLVQQLLSNTDWSGDVHAVRPVRDQIRAALGLPPPKPRPQPTAD